MTSGEWTCTCWAIQTETGQQHPAAWIGLHQRVALITRGDQRVEGRPVGVLTVQTPTGEIPEVEVEQDDGEYLAVPLTDVALATAIPSPDAYEVVAAIVDALRHPLAVAPDPVEYAIPAGDHHQVEIMIRRVRAACAPNLTPPRIFFTIVPSE